MSGTADPEPEDQLREARRQHEDRVHPTSPKVPMPVRPTPPDANASAPSTAYVRSTMFTCPKERQHRRGSFGKMTEITGEIVSAWPKPGRRPPHRRIRRASLTRTPLQRLPHYDYLVDRNGFGTPTHRHLHGWYRRVRLAASHPRSGMRLRGTVSAGRSEEARNKGRPFVAACTLSPLPPLQLREGAGGRVPGQLKSRGLSHQLRDRQPASALMR